MKATGCLLSFGAESFVFQFAIQIFKDSDIQTYNFACCFAWSLTLKEKCKLTVFENRVLRRINGSTRNEITGEWRQLYDEELLDLYSSPNIIQVIKLRRMRWVRNVVCMGERKGIYRVLVGKLEGKR